VVSASSNTALADQGHTASVAGLLGIGGGMIVSPLLLELGVHPLVAAATSSLMVGLCSSEWVAGHHVHGICWLQ